MSKSKIKIYVTCFNNKIAIPDNELFELVQGGAANSDRHLPGMLHDDEGENISALNPRFNDAATIYWAWKNFDNDYYGFYQYRRFLSFNADVLQKHQYEYPYDTNDEQAFADMCLLDAEAMRDFIERYDVITCNYLQYDKDYYSLYQQFCEVPYEHEKDLNLLIEIVQQKYPEYMPALRKYLFEDGKGYFANVFIMRKEYFQRLCEWMFDILFEFDRRMDYTDYTFAERRVPGYCSERLIGIFYTYLQMNEEDCRFGTLQKCFFKTTREQPLDPVFEDRKRTIPIVLSAGRQSLPYCSVTVQSIIDHSSPDYFYDIVILHEEITPYAIKRFLETRNNGNCSIRFVNVSSYFVGHKLCEGKHESKEAYYRFALCDIMRRYDKVIYLDNGTVVLDDIATLGQVEIDEYALAAVRKDRIGTRTGHQAVTSRHTTSSLCEQIQSGVLVYNTQNFDRLSNWKKLFQDAEMRPDSDAEEILSEAAKGHVKWIDDAWSVSADALTQSHMDTVPKILRYNASQKLRNELEPDLTDPFWETAERSPLYSDIAARQQLRKFDRYFPGYKSERKTELANGQEQNLVQLKETAKEPKTTFIMQKSPRPWECILEETAFPDIDLSPAFEKDNVAIELLSSAYYLPYLAVTIQSIIESANPDKNYDIIVFTDGIPEERREKLKRVANGYANVSIRFADVSQHLALLTGTQLPQYAKLIYCRVWMAYILKNYDQIICADSDMVVTTDISVFENYNFGDNFVLAAHEWCYGEYGDELGLDDYTKTAINAGFMVMNLKKVRETYPAIMLISMCNARSWKYMDQDLFNILFKGKIQYLNYDWNYRIDHDLFFVSTQFIQSKFNTDYKILSPKIIHYAGAAKPWNLPGVKFEELFWSIAERSIFYREIIIARIPAQYTGSYQLTSLPNLIPVNHPARKYIDFFFPKGTRRREFIKKIVRIFKN